MNGQGLLPKARASADRNGAENLIPHIAFIGPPVCVSGISALPCSVGLKEKGQVGDATTSNCPRLPG